MKDDHLQKYNPMSLSKKYAIMVTMTICTPFSKMSNFNSFTNLNLLCTMKINLMILFNEICKISWNKNFLRGWNCAFKGYISISFSVIIQINKDHIYSDLFIKSWFRRYICDVKIMHIKKAVAWITVRRRTRNHVTKCLYLYFILDAETYFWRYLTSKTFLLISINLWNMDAP